ncbi:hypothetical protein [Fischerella sp. PCC 9605]|nr:hypothetical protein [Fischerella sp. PCC 9605]
MSLQPETAFPIPEETVRVAKASFPLLKHIYQDAGRVRGILF